MNREQILSAIRNLACSQGFYGRLLDYIDCGDGGQDYLDYLVEQEFTDVVEMVMFLES